MHRYFRRFLNLSIRYYQKKSTRPMKNLCLVNWKDNSDCLKYLEKFGLTQQVIAEDSSLPADYYYLKHIVEILDESGIPVTTDSIQRFPKIFYYNCNYRDEFNIQIDNVAEGYLKYLEPFPYRPELRMPTSAAVSRIYQPIQQYHRRYLNEKEIVHDWPNSAGAEEEQYKSLANEQRRVLRQYYAWHLESDLCSIDRYMFNYSKTTGIRSLRSINELLRLLQGPLEFTKNKILRNFYLLSLTPERLTSTIKNVPHVGSLPLKKAVQINPRMLARSSEQLLEMEKLLDEFKVGKCDSPFRYYILALTPSTVRMRLHQIATGDMAAFITHPRVCELIYFFAKASRRLAEARQAGLHCISINTLTANEKIFQAYLLHGVDKNSDRSDIVHYLSRRLGVSAEAISLPLSRQKHRFHVPLPDIRDTTEALLEAGFSEQIILESMHVVLYPREAVMRVLKELPDKPELKQVGFKNGFVSAVSPNITSGTKFLDKRRHSSWESTDRGMMRDGPGSGSSGCCRGRA